MLTFALCAHLQSKVDREGELRNQQIEDELRRERQAQKNEISA
jgi:hypothetical protein